MEFNISQCKDLFIHVLGRITAVLNIVEHIHLFDEALIPAYLTDDEAGMQAEKIMEVKQDLVLEGLH